MFGMDMEDKLEKLNYLRKVCGGGGGGNYYMLSVSFVPDAFIHFV